MSHHEGLVRLVPWALAEPVAARLQALTSNLNGDDAASAADGILLLQDRYQRLAFDGMSRLQLPDHIGVHLGVMTGGYLFVARLPQHIELWSREYRVQRLAEAERLADELP